ncbi:APH(3') family aminoglycoside O-phosphotransferase [Deinococcus cellulosilyticus]|uniref:Aminoglycoside 3'-phosphotransferase n=1 Tax=Deinococcus cellulosilyticus (strain DSM 18568 / NBRC 106333 / KACC 11606 / 5516J-15) TaxID=1223518 RepID=A0A511MYS9_DEIC1|nr:APH(3') family aminoglycoside O-phosphotransferase [Deinococcus cellulosilyticus]GEM45501.1 aminoglycoside 3'-phosphotransferase [Deinococcus cellulosilyticus NBRC 106333 = KACC 11606]
MPLPRPLPESLQTFQDAHWQQNDIGRSQAMVYFTDRWFLKIQPQASPETLRQDLQALKWLQQHVPVPEVLGHAEQDGQEFLITSRIQGRDLSLLAQEDREKAVMHFARGLRLWHGQPTQDCPLDRSLDFRLVEARQRLEQGQIALEAFTDESPEDVLNWLHNNKPDEDLVLTHGDYCFPNVLVDQDRICGFVDVGRAGISDRYTDLTLALWSTEYNCGSGWKHVFLQAYGHDLDQEKLHYYSLLDRFS